MFTKKSIIIFIGVSNGPIQFQCARKSWPLLELLAKIRWVLAWLCSQNVMFPGRHWGNMCAPQMFLEKCNLVPRVHVSFGQHLASSFCWRLCTYQCQGLGFRNRNRITLFRHGVLIWSIALAQGRAFELSCCPGVRDIWIFFVPVTANHFPGWGISVIFDLTFLPGVGNFTAGFWKCQIPVTGEKKIGRRKVKNANKSVLDFSSPDFFPRLFRLFPAPTNCPWVSEDGLEPARMTFF